MEVIPDNLEGQGKQSINLGLHRFNMISLKLNCLLEQKSIVFIGMNQITQCLIYSKKLLDTRDRKLNPWTRLKKERKKSHL